jgi:hypothetical protein
MGRLLEGRTVAQPLRISGLLEVVVGLSGVGLLRSGCEALPRLGVELSGKRRRPAFPLRESPVSKAQRENRAALPTLGLFALVERFCRRGRSGGCPGTARVRKLMRSSLGCEPRTEPRIRSSSSRVSTLFRRTSSVKRSSLGSVRRRTSIDSTMRSA